MMEIVNRLCAIPVPHINNRAGILVRRILGIKVWLSL